MKTRVAAIEFGTSKIVTVIAQSSGRNSKFEIISCGRVAYAGYKDGDWVEWDNLAKAISNSIVAAQSEAQLQISEIYIGVPSEFIHVRTAKASVPIRGENSRVSLEDITAVEDMAADVYPFKDSPDMVIHRSPAWYSVDGGKHTCDPMGLKGDTLDAEISFVTASHYFIEDMRQIMGQFHITISGFLSPTFAQILAQTSFEDRDRSCALVDVGMYSTEFSVIEGDGITYHAVLPCGGDDITSALADQLAIRFDEAEQLKRDAVIGKLTEDNTAVGKAKTRQDYINDLCEVALGGICEMIKRTIEDANRLLGPRSCLYLTGGGLLLLRGGLQYLEEYTERKVKTGHMQTSKLGSPEYSAALSLVDLIFDSIDQRTDRQKTLPVRAKDGVLGLFRKSRLDDDEE